MADFEWIEYKKDDELTWPIAGEDLLVTNNSIYRSPRFVHAIFYLSPPNFSIFHPEFTDSMIRYYAYIPKVNNG